MWKLSAGPIGRRRRTKPQTALVHIGLGKTGSTFLQDVLQRRLEALKAAGIAYPRKFFKFRQHLGVAAAFKKFGNANVFRAVNVGSEVERRAYRDRLIASLAALRTDGQPTVLFSSEHIGLLAPDELADLAAAFSDVFAELKICAFIRRQDHMAVSAYSEAVRSGSTKPFRPPKPPLYDYQSILKPWEDAVGLENLAVFVFEPGTFRRDFFGWIGAPTLAEVESDNTHSSLDKTEIELMRAFYRVFPRFKGPQNEELRLTVLRAIDARAKGAKIALSPEQSAEIARRYAASNAAVSARYLGGREILPAPTDADV